MHVKPSVRTPEDRAGTDPQQMVNVQDDVASLFERLRQDNADVIPMEPKEDLADAIKLVHKVRLGGRSLCVPSSLGNGGKRIAAFLIHDEEGQTGSLFEIGD